MWIYLHVGRILRIGKFTRHKTACFLDGTPSRASISSSSVYYQGQPDKKSEADDIVITGVSGRFPQSDSVEEFKNSLFNKVDMVGPNDRFKSLKICKHFGLMKNLEQFDAQFFGITPKLANFMDPQQRKLLEVAFEAVVDSGTNPEILRGSPTGVFVGVDAVEAKDYWLMKAYSNNMDGYGYSVANYTLANRVSNSMDLKGPSMSLSGACSGSLVTLEAAVQSIQSGTCDAAIVAGSLIMLSPFSVVNFMELGALSYDAKCRAFDKSGVAYARSEAVAAILIQKRKDAKRVYATIRGVQSNADGHKELGFTYPSGSRQEDLIQKIYAKAGIHPKDVKYIEAHGTGTPAGDPEELKAIWTSFCKPEHERIQPLLVGSVKSNMGHSESAAGLCGIVKCIVGIQEGKLPPNLHFKEPRENTQHFFDGSVNIVTEAQPWNGGIMGINSFGIGGTNAHLILESEASANQPVSKAPSGDDFQLPLILPFSGRTEETVKNSIEKACDFGFGPKSNPEFAGLVHHVFKKSIRGHVVRGFGLVTASSATGQVEKQVEVENLGVAERERPVCFIFPGMGSQWNEMGKAMMKIDVFNDSLQKSGQTLRNCGKDLEQLLKRGNDSIFKNIQDAVPSITAIQIALFDTITSTGVTPDVFFGHSLGEILCGYADGSFTAEEALLFSEARGRALHDAILSSGLSGAMASVGLSWSEIASKCPPNVYPACSNSANNVTVSGEAQAITEFVQSMSAQGIFAKPVNSCGCAAHSPLIHSTGSKFAQYVQGFYPKERESPRSAKWISTSIPEHEWATPLAQMNSAAYHENNVIRPVLFYEAFKHIPKNAVVIEIAPTSVFHGILKRSLDPKTFVVSPMTSKGTDDEEKLKHFFYSLGKIYNAGVDVDMGALYPPVSFPVSAQTPGLSSLVSWNHEQNFKVPIVSNITKQACEGMTVKVDLTLSEDRFLEGHKLDSRIVYPATGYLVLAWKCLAQNMGVDFTTVPVSFKNVRFERATVLNPNFPTELQFSLHNGSGDFEIREDGATVVRGNITALERDSDIGTEEILQKWETPNLGSSLMNLKGQDVYKELRLRGYNYSGKFEGIRKMAVDGTLSEVSWTGNWISFLDTCLQTSVFNLDSKNTAVPVRLDELKINPSVLLQFAKAKEQTKEGAEETLVPVLNDKYLNTLSSPGIQVRGISLSTAATKVFDKVPLLEEYRFVPYFDNLSSITQKSGNSSDNLSSKSNSKAIQIAAAIDLILENLNSRNLHVLDVFERSQNSVTELVTNAMQSKPGYKAELSIASTQDELNKLSGSILKLGKLHDIDACSTTNLQGLPEADIIFVDQPIFDNLASLMKENCFIVSHTKDLNNHGLSKQPDIVLIAQSITSDNGVLSVFKKKALVDVRNTNFLSIDGPPAQWLNKLQSLISDPATEVTDSSKIYLTSQNNPTSGILGLVKCLQKERSGDKIRCIFDPEGTLDLNNPLNKQLEEILEKDLVMNVFSVGQLGSYRHLPLYHTENNGAKIETPSSVGTALNVESTRKMSEFARVNIGTISDFSTLRWIESPLKLISHDTDLSQNVVVCKVHYSAVNFKDIMTASGRLELPEFTGKTGHAIGLEFAGTDKDGQRVMGFVQRDGIATFVQADRHNLLRIPDSWTFEEAATVPFAYLTAYYAMFDRGRLQPGQSILIHSGTGGIGQAGINIALDLNCEIFTTVGTPEKRRFIKELFPSLKDENIFSSRDTRFEQQIMKQTQGKGVNVVLNTLSEHKLPASIRCLAKSGKFLDLGKFDGFQNNPLGMSCFLRNAEYHGVDLVEWEKEDAIIKKGAINALKDGIDRGVVKPLSRTVFNSDQVEEAFRFMANRENVGKVLIKIRDDNDKEQSESVKVPAIPRTYFHPNKIYIVVGGLGGLGLEVSNLLLERGAKHLVLVSRSGVTSGYQQRYIKKWNADGVTVETPQVNLTDPKVAKTFLKQLEQSKAVGGIFNSGLVLKDALIENQTAEMFDAVAAPKAQITKNLDQFSKQYCKNLDYFVVFSSAACGRGNAGQTPYGLANSVMERICEQRRQEGYPGLAIQWGIIDDVGFVAEETAGSQSEINFSGTIPQKIRSCLEVLDIAMNQSSPIFSSMVLSEQTSETHSSESGTLLQILSILGVSDLSTISLNTFLTDLGLDSLMATELRQTMERMYGVSLTIQQIRKLTIQNLLDIDSGTFDSGKTNNHSSISNPGISASQLSFNLSIPQQMIVKLGSFDQRSKVSDVQVVPKLFFVHGIQGFCKNLDPLSLQLKNVEAYGLQLTDQVSLASVEDIAARYIQELKTVQPIGPYNLAGYSSGAIVAFEMISQLEKSYRDKVSNFILLDGWIDLRLEKDDVRPVSAFIMRFFTGEDEKILRLMEKLDKTDLDKNFQIFEEFLKSEYEQSDAELESVQNYLSRLKSYTKALFDYRAAHEFLGATTLIKVTDKLPGFNNVRNPSHNIAENCSGELVVKTVKGDHHSFLYPIMVSKTADIINKIPLN